VTIKVLGPGCLNCKTLEQRTHEALGQMNFEAQIEKVVDYPAILSHGVLSTPGLVIDGKVVSQGRVPSVEAIKELIKRVQ
jgi:small redox-active disulfide protein 2